ncbi:MAG: RNA 2',3'-cyclic phosphodiesterase [Armatimonadetes bacterium]|nr:RNA 2',3'-cyclic phosphodiesterase [Armatimonadota bacterium]
MRCFLAVRLPDGVKRKLVEVQEQVEQGAPGFYSWTAEEAMHLTLYFLGETEEGSLEGVKDALAGVQGEPFRLRVEGLVRLPEPTSPRVLAGGIAGDLEKLARFQQRLSDTIFQLAAFKETRRYYPHVTFGRLRRGMPGNAKAVKRTLAKIVIEPTAMFENTEYVLIRSNPGNERLRYETLETYKLG